MKNEEQLTVHYLSENEEETLCGRIKKYNGTGPWWVMPQNKELKSSVNCKICIDTLKKAIK